MYRYSNGQIRLSDFNAYNESGNLQEIVERFKEREGHYPERVLADKIYRTRENLRYCNDVYFAVFVQVRK